MLTALEIVLGIDNIIFISILVGRLPPELRDKARRLGLGFAMVSRLMLLFSLSWIMGLTTDLFTVMQMGFSGRDMVLLLGGLFLLYKASHEIFVEVVAREQDAPPTTDAVAIKAAGTKTVLGHWPDRHHRHRVLAGLGDHRRGHGGQHRRHGVRGDSVRWRDAGGSQTDR
jgi:predicted tellurium resistance membrane protein TerC